MYERSNTKEGKTHTHDTKCTPKTQERKIIEEQKAVYILYKKMIINGDSQSFL